MTTTPKGAVEQKDGSYAIVPHFPLGLVTAKDLRKVADAADKFAIPIMKITAASRIAMVGFTAEQVEEAWEELGLAPGHAVGLCVRSIQACPGTTICKLGKQDALGLGNEIDKRFHGLELPNKCKIGVSGCLNSCAESWVKDIGFIGKTNGWTVVVGGNAAARPRLADELYKDLTTEQALDVCEKILNYYKANGKKSERIGRFIERIGLDTLAKEVCPECAPA